MKKIIRNTVSKLLLLVTFVLTQLSVFAADGGPGEESRWQVVSRMPKFWIGVAAFIVLLALGIFSGRNKNSQAA